MTASMDAIANSAATDPALLFSSSIGTADGETRDSGLILTKEQIIHIRKYELRGLALPTTLARTIAYLGYKSGAGKGLEPPDFLKTFTLIHGHASLWTPLRNDLVTVNDRLVLFAGYMQVMGETMNEVFSEIVALGAVEKYGIKTLEDLRKYQAQGVKFPEIRVDQRDELGEYLNDVLKKVKERQAEANSIKVRLDHFGKQLANEVAPEIKLKLKLIDNNKLGDEVKALRVRIENRAKDIEEKNKEYSQLVKDAVSSALSNIVTMIYSSVQAEKVRKERKKLRDQQEADIKALELKETIIGSLERVRMDFQDLDMIVLDADLATKNLITVWSTINTFVTESSVEVDAIHDGLSMRRFKNKFNLVVAPWKTIEADTRELQRIFAEADQAARSINGV
ncbi:alpha-xenorhabdolysin family binary toxin subunit A [Pseudomonas sp. NPDC088444]|uniref:alpha-xenorhabdolysin family binary toxin subunit A n=1 Tax=Pseudomonas sp. NPDC088444 TaxID=3364456 RepID=UPI003850122C